LHYYPFTLGGFSICNRRWRGSVSPLHLRRSLGDSLRIFLEFTQCVYWRGKSKNRFLGMLKVSAIRARVEALGSTNPASIRLNVPRAKPASRQSLS
jgi:hypothetical protein